MAKNVSAVVGRYCCHTVSEDRVRVSEFLFGGGLIVYRDWYDSGSKYAFSKDKTCDIINFFAVE